MAVHQKRLWKKYDDQKRAGVAHPQLESGRKRKCGQKGINIEELRGRLHDIPLSDRTTQRRLASALGIPSSRLHDNLEKLGLRTQSNALKPYLTDEGKRERVVWVLRWVRTTAAAGGYRVLHDFEDFVHVDEKWFYLFQDGQDHPLSARYRASASSRRSCLSLLLLARVTTCLLYTSPSPRD